MPEENEDTDFRDTLTKFEDFTSNELAQGAIESEEDADVGTLPA